MSESNTVPGSNRHRTRQHRWMGAVLVLLFGVVGAMVGWTVATTMLPAASSSSVEWVIRSFAVLAAVVAGPVVGGFAGLLLLRGLRREVTCPRCGTANPRQADSCGACDLALMPLQAPPMR